MWLRELPRGEDDSVNTTPEEHIRALFDTGQAANTSKSKVAEGLRSWAKFGSQIAGPKTDKLAQITQLQVREGGR